MRIELEPPFKDKWRLAYLLTCPDSRRRVFMYNGHDDRFGMSYARYLMCVKLGRLLTKDEHVDHIDEDKTNDDIENLQILTPEENQAKNAEWRKKQGCWEIPVLLSCPVCETDFVRSGWAAKKRITKGLPMTCSKSCSAKLQAQYGRIKLGSVKKVISQEHHALIIELRAEGKSDYAISEISGISRAKVHRYRKENNIP